MAAAIKPKELGLTSEVMAQILKKEKEIGLRLESIMFADSRDHREYLYGKFGKGKNEVIVTLAERIKKKLIVV